MVLLITALGLLVAALFIWPGTGRRLLGWIRALCTVLAGLSQPQRKLVYKIAAGIGLAIVAKFGLDAHSFGAWSETVGVFVATVLVPLLAHSKVDGTP